MLFLRLFKIHYNYCSFCDEDDDDDDDDADADPDDEDDDNECYDSLCGV